MKKKLSAPIMSVLLATALLIGCGSKEASQPAADTKVEVSAATALSENTDTEATSIVTEPTQLTFIFADGDEGAKIVMNDVVNKFNAAYPDITVTIEPGNGGAYSELLKTKDSVGEFPDIMEMRDTAVYVRAGKLAPLPDDVVNLFKTTTAFDGQVYTAPLAAENTNGIIYNKAYFDENGWTEPQTYDEFLELCQKIKDKGDMAPLVVGGQDIWHMGFWFHKAYNDQVLSKDPDFIKHCYEGTKDFSDDSIKATFEELKTIMQYAQDGWVSTPDAQINTFFVNDMAAMMYSGTHMFAQVSEAAPEFEMGWFAVPSPDGKTRLVGGGGAGGLAISAEAAQDPNKKAVAEEFIRFFFAPENYQFYCERMSAIPSTVEVPELNVTEVFQEVVDATGTADALSPMWNGFVGENELPPDFRNFTYKTLIEVLQDTRDIDSACNEMNKTWNVAKESFNPITGTGITQ
jgi:raffinose/stachyose/melibiose transport system substrate-binding protein